MGALKLSIDQRFSQESWLLNHPAGTTGYNELFSPFVIGSGRLFTFAEERMYQELYADISK